jgi:cell division protein FtsN
MKSKILYFIILIFIASACGGSKKSMKKSSPPPPPAAVEQPVAKPEPPKPEPVIKPVVEEPIKEVAEKLVPIKEVPPAPNQYFVIIGSFRNYDNAINFQRIISSDRFVSILLRNEKGLYRVSVLGTNNIAEARNEIRRIRSGFPKYNDTWLLIQEK